MQVMHPLAVLRFLGVFFLASVWIPECFAGSLMCISKKGPCIKGVVIKEECHFNVSFKTRPPFKVPVFGFGEQMANASIFMVDKKDNNWTVEAHTASGYTMPKLDDVRTVTMLGVNISGSWVHLIFKRPVASQFKGQHSIVNRPQSMVYALFDEDMANGHGPNVGSFMYNPYMNATDIVIIGMATRFTTFKVIHIVCMATAWSFCSFAGVFIARYLKNSAGNHWFKLHVIFFVLVFLLSAGGFAVIVYEKKDGPHFTTPHGILGLAMVCGLVLQILLGIIIDRMFDPTRTRIPGRDKIHWVFGHILTLAGAACVILGHYSLQANTILYLGINAGVISLCFVAFIFGEFKFGQQHEVADKRSTLSMTERHMSSTYETTGKYSSF